MTTIGEKLDLARAEVARLERIAAAATCRELGKHDWQSTGGKNAGCGYSGCGCSVPVYVCARCGDCDYGDNDEARETVSQCAGREDALDTIREEAAEAGRTDPSFGRTRNPHEKDFGEAWDIAYRNAYAKERGR